jgi:predicted dehydrogenase
MKSTDLSPIGGRPVRWGILGTANIAEAVVRGIRESDNSVLSAVASRTEARANAWAQQHEIPRAFASYDALLAAGEVDAIYVPLPNALHAAWTVRALEAGYPVLCEKPLAANAAEARAIAAASARTGRPVAEAFMYRFHPQWDRALALVRDGAIGEVASLHGQFTFLLDDPTAICASAELAGGALMDVGCYCVDFARQVAGREPLRATAFGNFGQRPANSVDRTMVGLLEFSGGLLAHFETSIASFERHRAEIAGTAGSIVFESPWVPGDNPARLVVRRPDAPPEEIVVPAANSYRLEVEDFAAACRGEKAPRWPIADGVANMTVIDALYASARKHAG